MRQAEAPPPALEHATPRLIGERPALGRSSVAVSIALFATSLLGAGQALLLVFIAGEGTSTDAFLAAYPIYLAVALLAASLRGSLVAHLGSTDVEETFRERASEAIGRILLLAGLLGLTLFLLAPVIALAVTHGLPTEATHTALAALVILVPAGLLHIWSASMAAVLNAVHRYALSAFWYVIASSVSLVTAAVLLFVIPPVGAALGLLLGTSLLALLHYRFLARRGLRPTVSRQWLWDPAQRALAGWVLAGSSLGVAMQVNLSIALSALPSVTGTITAYSYAFFLVAMMLNLSSLPLATVTLPDLVADLAAGRIAAAEEYVSRVAPFTFAVLVPLILGFVAYGAPLVEAVFGSALSDSSIEVLYDVGCVLGAMAVPTAFFYMGGAIALASRGARRLFITGGASIALQLLLVLLLADRGVMGVAWAHCAAATVSAGVLLWTIFGARVGLVVGRALWASAPALFLGAPFLLRLTLGDDATALESVAGLVISTLLYAVGLIVLWRDIGDRFVGLVRRG